MKQTLSVLVFEFQTIKVWFVLMLSLSWQFTPKTLGNDTSLKIVTSVSENLK